MHDTWLLIAIASTIASMSVPAIGEARTGAPNVLMLIADDLSASALGCYGNTQCRTPHLDALASQGVRFARAYCQYPVCGPSRAAIMSGLYPQSIGVLGNGQAEQFTANLGNRPSFAEWFRRNDYFTARVGKIYHMRVPGDITAGVDGPDHAASWDERYNCRGLEWMSMGTHYQLSNEPLNRDPDRHYGLGFGASFYVIKSDGDGDEQPDVQAADRAIELLQRHQERPFFLAVGFVRPHVPLVAPRHFFEPYTPSEIQLARDQPNDLDDIPPPGRAGTAWQRGLDSLRRQRQTLAAYYAAVSFMDAQVGRIVSEIDRLELRSNTIIVFLSDHGYHLGEHQLWQKQSLHEESTRIPLIVAAPMVPARVATGLAEQIDLYPTISELAGLGIPDHCQGRSLVDAARDGGLSVRDAAYCIRGRNDHLLRTDHWALIRYQNQDRELYDMQNDPYQFTNLAGDSRYQATQEKLETQLDARLREIDANR